MALLYLLFFLLLSPPTTADFLSSLCLGNNYTAKSAYQSNLNLLLATLSSTNSSFSNVTEGSIPDRVYGLILCRGDVSTSECRSCIQTATQDVVQQCQSSKEVTLWYDNCELRYSDETFFSSDDNSINIPLPSKQNATDPASFSKLEQELMSKLYSEAAYRSPIMFATGKLVYGPDASAIYGLVQCTRDLSKDACHMCLQQIGENWRSAQVAGRFLEKSCNFRYDVHPFFEGEPTISLTAPPSSPALVPISPPRPPDLSILTGYGGKGNKNIIIISIVIPVVVVPVLIFTIFFFFRRRSAKNVLVVQGTANTEEIARNRTLLFDLSILKVATANFSNANKLGQGGFGTVYKGTLPNGEEVAVKRLSASSRQGLTELKNELLLVAKLQHKNLVRLRGVCLEEEEKLLIYEYVPNRSLDNFLFDPIKCQPLNWERRFKIIGGIARGLLYLHEESHLKVIHRDLKSSNVLLDADLKPKIADFGLARLFGGNETHCVTGRVVGTLGYMSPEYAWHGQVSIKLDVYSFGILVLEIVTGKKNNSFRYDSEQGQDLLGFAWEHWRNGTILDIMDPSLGENYPRNQVMRCIQIGLLCAQEVPADRPLMSSVFLMLHSPSMPLQAPLQPKFIARMNMVYSSMSRTRSESGSSYSPFASKSASKS